ncbi:MAG: type II toxin-antitoxin system PemK/MazF family toxin [Pseudomonadota bacterium]
MRERGEIRLANPNPGRGTEPGKTRPVLSVQNQALLDEDHPSALVVPLTIKPIDDAARYACVSRPEVILRRIPDLLLDQLRAIDDNHLVKGPLQRCTKPFLEQVDQALREVLDLG